jgi:cytoskeletal protein CcmA (bactofilin family)
MKPTGRSSELNGFIDRGSEIKGELQFETHFRVHGKFSGTVQSEGELIVGEGGEVEGKVEIGQLLVSGIVRGTVTARQRIHITATGQLRADVSTPALVLEDGALFEGHCAMSRESGREAQRDAARNPAAGPKLIANKPAAREG